MNEFDRLNKKKLEKNIENEHEEYVKNLEKPKEIFVSEREKFKPNSNIFSTEKDYKFNRKSIVFNNKDEGTTRESRKTPLKKATEPILNNINNSVKNVNLLKTSNNKKRIKENKNKSDEDKKEENTFDEENNKIRTYRVVLPKHKKVLKNGKEILITEKKVKLARYTKESIGTSKIRKIYLKTDDFINGRVVRKTQIIKSNNPNYGDKKIIVDRKTGEILRTRTTIQLSNVKNINKSAVKLAQNTQLNMRENIREKLDFKKAKSLKVKDQKQAIKAVENIKNAKLGKKTKINIKQDRDFKLRKKQNIKYNKYIKLKNPSVGVRIKEFGKDILKDSGKKSVRNVSNLGKGTIKAGYNKGINKINATIEGDGSFTNEAAKEVVKIPSQVKTMVTTTKDGVVTTYKGVRKTVTTTTKVAWNGTKGMVRGGKTVIKTAKKIKKDGIKGTYQAWKGTDPLKKKLLNKAKNMGKEAGKGTLKLAGKAIAGVVKFVASNILALLGTAGLLIVVVCITMMAGTILMAIAGGSYEADDRAVVQAYDYITMKEAQYKTLTSDIKNNWQKIVDKCPYVEFKNNAPKWNGDKVNKFNIVNDYVPNVHAESIMNYISAKYEDYDTSDLTNIKKDIDNILKNTHKITMRLTQADDLTKPIYKDDLTKPIYADDLTKPIYTSKEEFKVDGVTFEQCKKKGYSIASYSVKEKPLDDEPYFATTKKGYDFIILATEKNAKDPKNRWLKIEVWIDGVKKVGYTKEAGMQVKEDIPIGYEKKIVGYKQKLVGYEQTYTLDVVMKGQPAPVYIKNNLNSLLSSEEKRDRYETYNELGGGMRMTYPISSPFDENKILCISKKFGYYNNNNANTNQPHNDYLTLQCKSGWSVYAPISGKLTKSGNTITIEYNGDEKQTVILKGVNCNVSNGNIEEGKKIGTTSSNELNLEYKIGSTLVNPKMYIENEAFYTKDGSESNFISEAEKYIDYYYFFGGKAPYTSFDCSGFVCYAMQKSGYKNISTSAQGLFNACVQKNLSESDLKVGDLIFFKETYSTSDTVTHVGIVVDPKEGIMLHCGSPIQFTSYKTSYWQSHFYKYGRMK